MKIRQLFSIFLILVSPSYQFISTPYDSDLTANYTNPNSAIYQDGKCIKPALRQEIRDLTKEELSRFLRAIHILHSKGPKERYSKYEKLVRLHVNYYYEAHGLSAFMPWHRYFIRIYELELQKIDPTVILPYWDWSFDSDEPHKSPVLTNAYMGGQGDPKQGYCLVDGPFKGWRSGVDFGHCLMRRYDEGDQCSAFPPPEDVIFMTNYKNFSKFSDEVELAHGAPHVGIGSTPGDFSVAISPNDPIFYIHHAFVDLVFELYIKKHPDFEYEGELFDIPAHSSDILRPFGKTVDSSFDLNNNFFCYKYAEYPRRLTPHPTVISPGENPKARAIKLPLNGLTNPALGDLANLDVDQALAQLQARAVENGTGKGRSISLNSKKLKPRKPLPEAWLKKNRKNIQRARETEMKKAKLVEALNNLPIYVPISE